MSAERPVIVNRAEVDWESWGDPDVAARSPVRWKLLIAGERGPSRGIVKGILEVPPGASVLLHHHEPEETYDMRTNVSGLLRDFAKVRRAALAGKRIVVTTREGNLVLTAESQASAPAATSSGGARLSSASSTAGGRRFVSRAVLADAARTAPRIDAQRFRDDLDAVIDSQVDG